MGYFGHTYRFSKIILVIVNVCVCICMLKERDPHRGRDEVPDIIWLLGGVTNKSNC